MKLKVCGMKYSENIREVAALKPDYLGFIFWEPSKRYFEGTIPELPKTIKKVGVFVDALLDVIIEKTQQYRLHSVQLHGSESPEFCQQLKALPIEIIKVFSVGSDFDFGQLKPYETVCDYYLFDTKGKLPGGNGYTFDWTVLKKYPSTKPYFLSGGIGLEDAATLKDFLNRTESTYCYAVDVNSRFEVEPGLKDVGKLKKFRGKG
ncbi:phosphoribosylanthranilate isomerase [Arenibacter sp. GZD96]|uniref:phosphoribosylanthranilate isomerase n=1 Tax=Aurantibrevibacter litoralis TaxID=3106030 RepID=UPI002AFFF9FD|nr:phosphoribosylanthranilate isomerase [Arenibacter sp. GZD-96]MEA1786821.1 phosphoribosylanthranilate isomerase [Arenibacter sp. GZD-96]